MKIGIDISQIVYGTGVSNYTKNLVDALFKIDKKNEYVLFGGSLRRIKELQNFHKTLAGRSVLKAFPLSPMIADFLWNKLHMFPIENFVGEVDIFHASDWTQPPARRAKLVTTIHDLVPILYPETSHPKIVAAHKKRLEWIRKEADGIIAVSQATQKDIVKHLGIPQEKISVIYEAVNPSVKRIGERLIGETRRKYKIPEKYFLMVGADPRKNLERIAQAVQNFGNIPLVVVGRKWPNLNLTSHNIIWAGYVTDPELSALYSGAQALVYATLYEGFGLPILNAFVCQTPVVTSNVSSMPEVAGDAAVLVDPLDADDIARGINDALSKKNELIKKGLARVKKFSWGKAARQTLAIYEKVANG